MDGPGARRRPQPRGRLADALRAAPALSAPAGGESSAALTLAERVVALHDALATGGVPHAFGGAIALAYWTLDPRATGDIDLNVFVPSEDPGHALRALPAGIAQPPDAAATILRDGQIRLWWGETPVDLFFDYAPVHSEAARHRQTVPFADRRIPVLGPVELGVFKAMYDRTRDWADIEAMLGASTLDPTRCARASARCFLRTTRGSRDSTRRSGGLGRRTSSERVETFRRRSGTEGANDVPTLAPLSPRHGGGGRDGRRVRGPRAATAASSTSVAGAAAGGRWRRPGRPG